MIEIDGVRGRLRLFGWESGDYISDEYLLLVDLSTSPVKSHANARRIASAIRRLNRNLDTTSQLLVGSEFADPYDSTIEQLNGLNVHTKGLDALRPLNREDSRFQDSSGSFKWATK